MSSAAQVAERSAEIAKVLETDECLAAFQRHLEDILHGEAFKGSHRSGQFLRHIVEQAIAGHCDGLKERLIGVELFGRSPSYDTGEDAIVRVTASDVRKRLLQHYGTYGSTSEFRIRLPLGTYIPEIVRESPAVDHVDKERNRIEATVPELIHTVAPKAVTVPDALTVEVAPPDVHKHKGWKIPLIGAAILAIAGVVIVLSLSGLWPMKDAASASAEGLWGLFLNSSLSTVLITSDPDVAEIQTLTNQSLTLSDYANRHYIPEPDKVAPLVLKFAMENLRGDKAAGVDTPVAVSIAQKLSHPGPYHFTVHNAREIRLADLLTDANFILLGSPRSDPWTFFYSDHLDFRNVFDADAGQEIIRNVHPRSGEATSYIPTAKGFATGQSFATVSYLKNPDRRGRVLLIEGANAEGTEAAGELLTDSAQLANAMKKCGFSNTSLPSFQLLLRLSTMAGSPAHVDVIACHAISS